MRAFRHVAGGAGDQSDDHLVAPSSRGYGSFRRYHFLMCSARRPSATGSSSSASSSFWVIMLIPSGLVHPVRRILLLYAVEALGSAAFIR